MRLALSTILVLLVIPVFAQSRLDIITHVDDSTKVPQPYQWWLGFHLGGMEIVEHVDDPNNIISPLFSPNPRLGINAERHGRFFVGLEYYYYPLWQVLGLSNDGVNTGGVATGTDAVHNLGLTVGKDIYPLKNNRAFSIRPMAGPALSFLPVVIQDQRFGPTFEPAGTFQTTDSDGQAIFGRTSTNEPNFMNVLMTVAVEFEVKVSDVVGFSFRPYFTQGFATQYHTQVSYFDNIEQLDPQRASLISYGSNAGFSFQCKFRVFDSAGKIKA